jgi:hypothetical protein
VTLVPAISTASDSDRTRKPFTLCGLKTCASLLRTREGALR